MKKTLLTLSAAVLLTAPSLFAHENSLQEHLRIGQMLQKQEQKRLKNTNGAMNQYKYQHQHQYQGINSNRSSMGSMGGQRSGGGRR